MSYSIDDQHGTNICSGLFERHARLVAQQRANELKAPVLLYTDETDEEDEIVRPKATDCEDDEELETERPLAPWHWDQGAAEHRRDRL